MCIFRIDALASLSPPIMYILMGMCISLLVAMYDHLNCLMIFGFVNPCVCMCFVIPSWFISLPFSLSNVLFVQKVVMLPVVLLSLVFFVNIWAYYLVDGWWWRRYMSWCRRSLKQCNRDIFWQLLLFKLKAGEDAFPRMNLHFEIIRESARSKWNCVICS